MKIINPAAGLCGLILCACFASAILLPAPIHPASIPGIIEAEDYDTGGEGVAWHIAKTRPTGKSYRSDAADIRAIPGGGHAVYVEPGDWLRYTVDVKKGGMYTLELRTAHNKGSDPEIRAFCDGKDVTGSITVPYTGGIANRITLTRPGVMLQAGQHVFKLQFEGGSGFFLDSFKAEPGLMPTPGPKPDPAMWELLWSDDFSYTGKPDPTKWAYDIGGDGWGNNELEYYTDRLENARVEGGRLIIEVRKEEYKGRHYTSARLVTKGKHDILYGRVEVSAKLPPGSGTWPAIWMLGDWNREGWPASGEIDIMEHIGRNPGWIHGSAHSLKYYWKEGNQKTGVMWLSDAQTAFHEYAIEWYRGHMDFFVDNNKYLTVENDRTGWQSWPFDHPEYLILNIAMGGGWGGTVDPSALPTRMEVKYVRVYKHT
ncbi:MAG TPA: family 16 glycosylhydrolase [Bryobacteraceae bacterium]|nr:family 16 glycosylhydrolase [Bryobacteraceae bacterium]